MADESSNGNGSNWSGYAESINSLLAGFRNPISAESTALAREQISYASRRLSEIEEARSLGNTSGTLTSEEQAMFDEMETSAVSNLRSQVNSQTEDVWNTAIADLVNRGVLQGTVGDKILGTIASENVKTIAEGTTTIRGTSLANQLNAIQANKNRALSWDTMLSNESLGLLGTGSNYATSDINSMLAALGLGVNANITFAGLTSAEGIAANSLALTESEGAANRALAEALAALSANTSWGIAGLNANAAWNIANLSANTAWNIAGLNAATALSTAGLLSNAANTSSAYGLGGNVLRFLGNVLTSNGANNAWTSFMNSFNSGGYSYNGATFGNGTGAYGVYTNDPSWD